MHDPVGSERFSFPAPNSPPSTPGSVNGDSSLKKTDPISTPLPVKKPNIITPEITPPDHIQPTKKHQFRYTPPHRHLHSSDSEESEASGADSSSDEEDEKETSTKERLVTVHDSSDSDSDDDDDDKNDDDEQDEAVDYEIDDDDDDDDDDYDDDDSEDEPASPVRVHKRTSIIIRHADYVGDLTIEEVDENDMDYDSDTSIIHPTNFSEVTSNPEVTDPNADDGNDADNSDLDSDSDDSNSDSDSDSDSNLSDADDEDNSDTDSQHSTRSSSSLTANFSGLTCSGSSRTMRAHARALDNARTERYLRRQRRWRRGGNKKRRVDQSCGPGLGHEDIVPLLDDEPPAAAASATAAAAQADRRLRRRTDEPTNRPRLSQIVDRDVAARVLAGAGAEGMIRAEVMLADDDEEDPDEVMPPAWMFSSAMEVDTSASAAAAAAAASATAALGKESQGSSTQGRLRVAK